MRSAIMRTYFTGQRWLPSLMEHAKDEVASLGLLEDIEVPEPSPQTLSRYDQINCRQKYAHKDNLFGFF